MSFQSPLVLIALVAVPLLAVLYVRHERRRTLDAARFGNPALLPNLVDRSPGWRRHLPLAILLVGLTTLIVGVARPHANIRATREEATVVLAIDVSRSMKATDVQPSRLAAARAAAERFVGEVPKQFRIAVVSFATRAVVGMPPTADRSLVMSALSSLHAGQGTALGDAVALSVRIGQHERSSDGTVPPEAVLLISDGAAQGGTTSPQAAAARARAAHVPVYTIALGTPEGVVQDTLPGGFRVTIQVPPSPATLRQLATTTGGESFTAPDDQRLRDVYDRLASRLGHYSKPRELSDLFAAGALALLLVGGGLSAAWFRRAP